MMEMLASSVASVGTLTLAAADSVPRLWASLLLSGASTRFINASRRRLLAAAACRGAEPVKEVEPVNQVLRNALVVYLQGTSATKAIAIWFH